MNLERVSWKLSHAGLALVMVPLLFQVIAVFMLVRMLDQAEAERKQELHAKNVMLMANTATRELNFLSVSFITGLLPSALATKVGERNIRRQYMSDVRRIMSDLKAYPTTDLKEKLLIERLANTVEECMGLIDHTRTASLNEFQEIARDARRLSIEINDLGKELTEYEQQISSSQSKARDDYKMILFGMLGVNIVIAIVMALLFAKFVTERLNQISENSVRLGQNQPLAKPLYGTDEIARLDHVFHNMAAVLAEAARKERAVTDNALDVICSLNSDGRFTSVNPAAEIAWGYLPVSLIGRSMFELLASEDRAAMQKRIADLRDGNIDAITCETEISRKDGTTHHAAWSITYSSLDKSFFCVAHDITTRKKLELLKEQFLSIASHDLRSPLNSILGTLELIIAGGCGDVSEQATDKLRTTKRSITRLTSLINNLLDIEKLDSGEMPLTKERRALAPIIERSIEAVQGLADATNIEINADGTDAYVLADQDRLVQVFVNLLSNAIKCSPREGAVEISVVESESQVEIRISDQGPGLAAEFHQAIFERFNQVDGSEHQTRDGVGLGLAICKAIVEQHDGSIGVESMPGEGSTFYVRIPTTA